MINKNFKTNAYKDETSNHFNFYMKPLTKMNTNEHS